MLFRSVDNNLEVKKFFDAWTDSIQDPETRTFSYYKEYITQIKLDIEDLKDRKRYEVIMHECYPKNVGQVQLGFEQKDIMKLQVSMNYKWWTSKAYNAPQETKTSPWDRFFKTPTINNKEISLPSVPDQYTNDFSAFQNNVNPGLFDGRQ